MTSHPGLPPVAHRPAWAPYSPCGAGCLPPSTHCGSAGARLRLARRCVALLVVMLAGLPLLLAGGAPRRAVFRGVLRAAGVRLRVEGGPIAAPGRGAGRRGTLVVANHLSWIDVVALGAVQPVRMIAKREIEDWPLVGAVARRMGALFVDRAGIRTLPEVVALSAAALRGGDLVAVFPEGTTWCGETGGPFRRAAFQAAIDAHAPVRPVRITLTLPDGGRGTAGTFIGDDTLWDSLSRVLRLAALRCTLTVLPLLEPGDDRRELARRAEAAVTGTPVARNAVAETARAGSAVAEAAALVGTVVPGTAGTDAREAGVPRAVPAARVAA